MSSEGRRYNLDVVRQVIMFLLRRNPDGFPPYRVFDEVQEEIGCTPDLAQEYVSTVFTQLKKEGLVERCEEGYRIIKYDPVITPEDVKKFDDVLFRLTSSFGAYVQQWMLKQSYFRYIRARDTRKFNKILALKGFVVET